MNTGLEDAAQRTELERLAAMRVSAEPVDENEFQRRLDHACSLMAEHGLAAIYVAAGSNLYYFTGTHWHASERMAGAILTADGRLDYIAPMFEKPTFEQHKVIDAEIHGWQEHESPFRLFLDILVSSGASNGVIGIDEATPFHHFGEIRAIADGCSFVDARPVTAGCRMQKSTDELRLIQTAMDMTLEVHKSARSILRKGISTDEVKAFIDAGHKAIGSAGGNTFCAVQFGEATAYPHGVPYVQHLEDDDIVLIDTGCKLHSYNSDITRTYAFGNVTDKQRAVWEDEKAAQAVALAAAIPGRRCGDVDIAVREFV